MTGTSDGTTKFAAADTEKGPDLQPLYASMFGGLRGYLEDYLAHPATFLHKVEG